MLSLPPKMKILYILAKKLLKNRKNELLKFVSYILFMIVYPLKTIFSSKTLIETGYNHDIFSKIRAFFFDFLISVGKTSPLSLSCVPGA